MLFKRISPSAFAPAEEICVPLRAWSGGVELDKEASEDDKAFVQDISARPGRTFLRIITVGAGEWYSANNKADYFNEDARRHYPSEPEKGSRGYVDLDGGLKKYHDDTFMNYGKVYVEHQNSRKKGTPKGNIIKARINPDMHWGEVIIEIEDDLKDEKGKYVWRDVLENLANDIPVQWSQGCVCEDDVCSTCGRRAGSLKDKCSHLKGPMKFKLNSQGEPHVALTDAPVFHDISNVQRPAEIIAFTLQKVAGEQEEEAGTGYKEAADGSLYVPLSALEGLVESVSTAPRTEALNKMARMMKEVPAMTCPEDVIQMAGEEPADEELDECSGLLEDVPKDFILEKLKNSKKVLAPREFCVILLNMKPEKVPAGEINKEICGLFSDEGVNSSLCEELVEDGAYEPRKAVYQPSYNRTVDKALSLLGPENRSRRIGLTIVREPGERSGEAGKEASGEAGKVAREYVKYAVTAARNDPEILRDTVKRIYLGV